MQIGGKHILKLSLYFLKISLLYTLYIFVKSLNFDCKGARGREIGSVERETIGVAADGVEEEEVGEEAEEEVVVVVVVQETVAGLEEEQVATLEVETTAGKNDPRARWQAGPLSYQGTKDSSLNSLEMLILESISTSMRIFLSRLLVNKCQVTSIPLMSCR